MISTGIVRQKIEPIGRVCLRAMLLAASVALGAFGLATGMAETRRTAADQLPSPDEATPAAASSAQARIGQAIFEAEWIPAPNVSDGADGLGPLFNATRCSGCHGVGGEPLAGGDSLDRRMRSLVLRLSTSTSSGEVVPHPVYGSQLQDRAIPGIAAEGTLRIEYETHRERLDDGTVVELRRPRATIADPAYGDPGAGMLWSLRRPPELQGVGAIAAIDESEILAAADPDDRDGDGVSGKAGRAAVEDANPRNGSLARFGWKASVATLTRQTAEAFSLDMGLSTPLVPRPAGDCTTLEAACMSAPDGRSAAKGGFEVSQTEIDLIVAFLDSLGPPSSAVAVEVDRRGRRLFADTGCAACHRPSYRAAPGSAGAPSDGAVWLYSDLLLHDMGDDLADQRPEGNASGREWRTPPLWGLAKRLDSLRHDPAAGLLHDGRARSPLEAVLWHGGEASAARARFRSLSSDDRRELIRFLSRL